MREVPGRGALGVLRRLVPCLLMGCATTFTLPWADAQPVSAPVGAADWWRELESCSGRTGNFHAVRWYVVPGGFLVFRDRLYDGYWIPRENAVVFPRWRLAEVQRNAHIVRHELLHALLQREGHPAEFFRRKCRALVERPR